MTSFAFIRRRLAAGADLEEIERDLSADQGLDEERRSALWLYAWSRPGTYGPEGTPSPSEVLRETLASSAGR